MDFTELHEDIVAKKDIADFKKNEKIDCVVRIGVYNWNKEYLKYTVITKEKFLRDGKMTDEFDVYVKIKCTNN